MVGLCTLVLQGCVIHGDRTIMSFLHNKHSLMYIKYEKHFPKMYRDVGMAVPKTTQTRYMDGSV